MSSAMFPIYKYVATALSSLSGIPGGIFAPSLSIGAGIGADFHILFPDISISILFNAILARWPQ
jgi:H+/Cl- antiporter ClcA